MACSVDKIRNVLEKKFSGKELDQKIAEFQELATMNADARHNKANSVEEDFGDKPGEITSLQDANSRAKEVDKANFAYSEKHSTKLDSVISKSIKMMKEVADAKIKLVPADVEAFIEARGQFKEGRADAEIAVQFEATGGRGFRNRFTMGNQETLAHELVHSVINWSFKSNDDASKLMKSRLTAMFEKSRKELTWESMLSEDISNYSQADIVEAQERFSYIFGVDNDGKPISERLQKINNEERLHEFTAHLMTNEAFGKALEKVQVRDHKSDIDKDGKKLGFLDSVTAWFYNQLDSVAGILQKEKGKDVKSAGIGLVFDMIAIKDKHMAKKNRTDDMTSYDRGAHLLMKTMDSTNSVLKPVVNKILEVTLGDTDRELSAVELNGLVNAQKKFQIKKDDGFPTRLYKVTRMLPMFRMLANNNKESAKIVKELLRAIGLDERMTIIGILKDFKNGSMTMNAVTDLLSQVKHVVDGARENVTEVIANITKDSFKEIDLTDKSNNHFNLALNEVILKTDLQSLGLKASELRTLLESENEIDEKIKDIKSELEDLTGEITDLGTDVPVNVGKRMIEDAENLAKYLNTGNGLMTNARNITAGFGTGAVSFDRERMQHTDSVDELVSLMVLKNIDTESKKNVIELIKKDEAGVDTFIDFSENLQDKSKTEMDFSSHSHVKGYYRETFDKNRTIKVVPLSMRNEMIKEGYEFIGKIETSRGDSSGVEFGRFASDKIARREMTDGIISKSYKFGTDTTKFSKIIRMANPEMNKDELDKVIEKAISGARRTYSNQTTRKKMAMTPLFNSDGSIYDFAYSFSHDDKAKYLGKEDRGLQNLAHATGQIGAVPRGLEMNKIGVDLLHEDYEKDFKEDPEAFVEIKLIPEGDVKERTSLDARKALAETKEETLAISDEEKFAEMWSMMPPDTRKYINKKFGKNVIVVKREVLDQVFGYKKESMMDWKMFQWMSKDAIKRGMKYEKYWMDAVGIGKNAAVIKTPATVIGNISSNFNLTALQGFNQKDVAEKIYTSKRMLDQLEIDKKEKTSIESKSKGARSKTEEYRLKELDQKMRDNPHHKLIEEFGMFQSLVEDVSVQENSNKLAKSMTDLVDGYLPKPMAWTVHQIFMTEKTKSYQMLLKLTQRSDYHFKFATYYLMKERLEREPELEQKKIEDYLSNKGKLSAVNNFDWKKTDPKIGKDVQEAIDHVAMRTAVDNHINYNANLHPTTDLLDRLGMTPFIRYAARIQRVNFRLLKENPTQLMLNLMAQETFGETSDVMDKFWVAGGIGSNIADPLDNTFGLVSTGASPHLMNIMFNN